MSSSGLSSSSSGRRQTSSSSFSSDHSHFCDDERRRRKRKRRRRRDVVPKRASLWKKQHLESLGISYNEGPSTTEELIAVLKRQVVDLHMEEIPEICQRLIELTKHIFSFSFNFNDPHNSEKNLRKLRKEMERMSQDFESKVNDFRSQHSDLLQDKISGRVFQYWVIYTSEFLSYLKIFTVRYQMLETREGSFTQLLGQFTRLCLLVPERGDSFASTIKIKGTNVSGIPKIRYPSHEKEDEKTINIVTMAEVKESDSFRGDTDAFHIGLLSDGVLGQHGVELLLENYRSFFRPVVSGLICIGTKIIFTVLEIDGVHYVKVQEDGIEEVDKKSTILYSKPYDYMDSNDRGDILEFCFWLGYVQHEAYKSLIHF